FCRTIGINNRDNRHFIFHDMEERPEVYASAGVNMDLIKRSLVYKRSNALDPNKVVKLTDRVRGRDGGHTALILKGLSWAWEYSMNPRWTRDPREVSKRYLLPLCEKLLKPGDHIIAFDGDIEYCDYLIMTGKYKKVDLGIDENVVMGSRFREESGGLHLCDGKWLSTDMFKVGYEFIVLEKLPDEPFPDAPNWLKNMGLQHFASDSAQQTPAEQFKKKILQFVADMRDNPEYLDTKEKLLDISAETGCPFEERLRVYCEIALSERDRPSYSPVQLLILDSFRLADYKLWAESRGEKFVEDVDEELYEKWGFLKWKDSTHAALLERHGLYRYFMGARMNIELLRWSLIGRRSIDRNIDKTMSPAEIFKELSVRVERGAALVRFFTSREYVEKFYGVDWKDLGHGFYSEVVEETPKEIFTEEVMRIFREYLEDIEVVKEDLDAYPFLSAASAEMRELFSESREKAEEKRNAANIMSRKIQPRLFKDTLNCIQAKSDTRSFAFVLGTGWIKGYEEGSPRHKAINPLVTSIRRFCEKRGIPFSVEGDAAHLAAAVSEARKTGKKVVVLAGKSAVMSSELSLLKDDKDVFLAGVNEGTLTEGDYPYLMELLIMTLRLAFHDEIHLPMEANSHIVYTREKGLLIFSIRDAEPMDYETLKPVCDAQTFA
ncbi:MAG: hypothetical protein ABIH74_04130, partial [Candidatus Omnitrophota bacterium]